jgi:erythromycin esterase-like protein
MAETLESLARHLENGSRSKIVVWAHNSHLGDARATDMGRDGEHNLGQLVRERHGDEALLVGFSTYQGTVTAADDWDQPARVKRVNPGLDGSYEADFHALRMARFALFIDGNMPPVWRKPRLQRAIGVIYRPETERASHYFHANLAKQFDVMIHFDKTRALQPLDPVSPPAGHEVPETFPTGK